MTGSITLSAGRERALVRQQTLLFQEARLSRADVQTLLLRALPTMELLEKPQRQIIVFMKK